MSEHEFQMRLFCRYQDSENSIKELLTQNLSEGDWRDFDLNPGQPGFLIFVYAILNCQHLYLRTNAAERGLLFDSANGFIDVCADQTWELQKVHVQFDVRLKSGKPLPEDVTHIIARMQHCPVSINLKDIPDSKTSVEFA
jgi:hypothetical protein